MAAEVRRLQVGQIGHGLQDGVEVGAVDPLGQAWFGVEDRVPFRRVVEPVEYLWGVPAEEIDDPRIKVGAGVAPRRVTGSVHAVPAGVHLDRTGELHQPGRQGDRGAAQTQRYAPAVPLLVALPERVDRDRVE